MYIETKIVIMKKFPKIYIYFCLCGNTRNLEKETLRMRIEESNELLREDYMKSLKNLKRLYTSNRLILEDNNIEKI